MTIVTKNHRGETVYDTSVADYVSQKLTGRYDSDGSEADRARARAMAETCAEAFGRLIEVLAERGALTAEQVMAIAGEYGKTATFQP